MKQYKFVEHGREFLLCSVLPGVYELKEVDRGIQRIETKSDSLTGLVKNNGLSTYYLIDETTGKFSKFAEDVCEDELCEHGGEQYLFFRRGLNYFFKDLADQQEKALGTWKEHDFFFSGKEGAVTASFFLNGEWVCLDYVSVYVCKKEYCSYNIPKGLFLRKDGLYDLVGDGKDGFQLFSSDYVKVRTGVDFCRMFFYDRKSKGYKLIFSGRNLIGFRNAVMERVCSTGEESDCYLFYYFDGGEKILLCATDKEEDVSCGSNWVEIDGTKWSPVIWDISLLNPQGVPVVQPEKTEVEEYNKSWWARCFG